MNIPDYLSPNFCSQCSRISCSGTSLKAGSSSVVEALIAYGVDIFRKSDVCEHDLGSVINYPTISVWLGSGAAYNSGQGRRKPKCDRWQGSRCWPESQDEGFWRGRAGDKDVAYELARGKTTA
jgi:hypothetical protein